MLLNLLASFSSLGVCISVVEQEHIPFVPMSLAKSFRQIAVIFHAMAALCVLFVQEPILLCSVAFVSFQVCFLTRLVSLVQGRDSLQAFFASSGEWGFAILILFFSEVASFVVFVKATVALATVAGLFGALMPVLMKRFQRLSQEKH
jgi:hypothetical protein